jgi:SET domain-containing protein
MGVIIRSSSLHGAGVYTTSCITEGTRILEYTGPRLHAKQTDGMYAESEATYLFGMDDGKTVIDGFGMAAFVNHSCHPNCETDEIEGRIWIIALHDIAAGEELTYDYNIYDAEPGEKCPCYCGAPDCRKTMYSEEEVKRQERILQRRKKRRTAQRRRQRAPRRRAA